MLQPKKARAAKGEYSKITDDFEWCKQGWCPSNFTSSLARSHWSRFFIMFTYQVMAICFGFVEF